MFAAETCGSGPDGKIIADRFEDDVSLAVKGEKGWSLLLGCAHAGLPNIMQRAKDLFAIRPSAHGSQAPTFVESILKLRRLV